jgi:hypothetical protein
VEKNLNQEKNYPVIKERIREFKRVQSAEKIREVY